MKYTEQEKEIKKLLTPEKIIELEREYNICIDEETVMFNKGTHQSIYGWEPIPIYWFKLEGNKENVNIL